MFRKKQHSKVFSWIKNSLFRNCCFNSIIGTVVAYAGDNEKK